MNMNFDELVYIWAPRIFVLSLVQTIIYFLYRVEIFDWNPETEIYHPKMDTRGSFQKEEDIKKEWKNRKKTIGNAPCAWKVYRFLLEFSGVFMGWTLLSYVVYKVNIIEKSNPRHISDLWNLIITLLVALVGIAGRIPVIIDSVQSWFKR